MKRKLYICEYPYVLYKVLIRAALNKDDIYDIAISNRLERMADVIDNISSNQNGYPCNWHGHCPKLPVDKVR